MKKVQEMVLVIDRASMQIDLIPPLQIIIPALVLTSPFSLYSSLVTLIQSQNNHFDALIEHLRTTAGESSLTQTLKLILSKRKQKKFRVCILGGKKVNWDIVLQYKRQGIVIDTVGKHLHLNQVSYTTGGIAKEVTPDNVIQIFLTIFSMSTEMRKYFTLEQNKKISFNLECKYCKMAHQCREEFVICTVCLAVYCPAAAKLTSKCKNCGHVFDAQEDD